MSLKKISSFVYIVTIFLAAFGTGITTASAYADFGNYPCVKNTNDPNLRNLDMMRDYVVRTQGLTVVDIDDRDQRCGQRMLMEEWGNTPKCTVSSWVVTPGRYLVDSNGNLRYRWSCMNRLACADEGQPVVDQQQQTTYEEKPVRQPFDWSPIETAFTGLIGCIPSAITAWQSCQVGGFQSWQYQQQWIRPPVCTIEPIYRDWSAPPIQQTAQQPINIDIYNQNTNINKFYVSNGGGHKKPPTPKPTPICLPTPAPTPGPGQQPAGGGDTSASGSAYALNRNPQIRGKNDHKPGVNAGQKVTLREIRKQQAARAKANQPQGNGRLQANENRGNGNKPHVMTRRIDQGRQQGQQGRDNNVSKPKLNRGNPQQVRPSQPQGRPQAQAQPKVSTQPKLNRGNPQRGNLQQQGQIRRQPQVQPRPQVQPHVNAQPRIQSQQRVQPRPQVRPQQQMRPRPQPQQRMVISQPRPQQQQRQGGKGRNK